MSVPDWLLARPIAHRGLHDGSTRYENTLAAADAAVSRGYGIECDVQLSADGEAMLFHDWTLDRLTGHAGPVAALDAAALGRIDVGGTADRIPTLASFLDRVAGRVPVIVEIKSRHGGDERLARRSLEIIAGREAPIVVKSFDPAIVSLVRRIAPSLPRGIVAQSRYEGGDWDRQDEAQRHAMANLLHWPDTQPDFLSWRHVDLPNASTFLPRTLAAVPVMAWTVRSADDASRALRHADQIVFEGFVPA